MTTLRLVPATGSPIEVSQDGALLGRDPGCDIVLSDGSVSRKHARLEHRAGGWFVVDQGSANGTYVDSARATDTPLRAGQEIRFGAVSFRLEIIAEVGATLLTETEPVATVLQPAVATPARPVPPAVAVPRPAPAPPSAPVRPSAPPAPARVSAPRPPGAAGPFVPKPVKKGHGAGFWITIGCCGCLTVIGLLALLFGAFWWSKTSGAATVAREHISEIRRGDEQAAYARLSESLRSQMSVEQFQELLSAHPALKGNTDATLTGRAYENGRVRLTFALTGSANEQEVVQYSLVSEEGGWRIAAIDFPGPSAP
jgi:hypothetical protein